MADMLGKSGPYDPRTGCCSKHGGATNMTPKRMKEDREWRSQIEDELADESYDPYGE